MLKRNLSNFILGTSLILSSNLYSKSKEEIFNLYESNVLEYNGKFTRKNFWDSFYENNGDKNDFFRIYREFRDKKTSDVNLDKDYAYLFKTNLYGNKRGVTLKSKLNKLRKYQCGDKDCVSYLIETQNYYGNNVNFIISKLFVEGMDPKGYSNQNAKGLGQIIRSTAKAECGMSFSDLDDIKNNIDCMSLINSDSFKKYRLDPERFKLSAIRYHGGSGTVRAYLRVRNNHKKLKRFELRNPKTTKYWKMVLNQKRKLDKKERKYK